MVRPIQDSGSWFDAQSIDTDSKGVMFKTGWTQKQQWALGKVFQVRGRVSLAVPLLPLVWVCTFTDHLPVG